MVEVYLSDLAKDKQDASFMGEEINELKRKAEKWGCDVVVGEFLDKPYLNGENPDQGKIR